MALAVSLPKTVKQKWNKNKNWQHRASLVFCEDTRFLEKKPLIKAIRKFFSSSISISWSICLEKNSFFFINLFSLSSLYRSFFVLEFYTIASGYLDHHRKRKFMLISIETRHRCLASRSRFIHGFKMFLSINSVYIGIFDFFQEIVNLD